MIKNIECFRKQCSYKPQTLIFNAMNGTEEKEKQQCNVIANYVIVTILMGASPAAETLKDKVLLKSVVILVYYTQTVNYKTQDNIRDIFTRWEIYQPQTEV